MSFRWVLVEGLVAGAIAGTVLWFLDFYGCKDEIYFAWKRRCEVLEQENRELREYIRVNFEKKGTNE